MLTSYFRVSKLWVLRVFYRRKQTLINVCEWATVM